MSAAELGASPDLAALAGAARDAGVPAILFERPMPDAVGIAGLGTAFEVIGEAAGARLVDAAGTELARRDGPPLAAAAALWAELAPSLPGQGAGPPGTGPVALAGFAFRPEQAPSGAWAGFPGVLLRVPRLAVVRSRGRTYAWGADEGAAELLELGPGFAAPPARRLVLEPVRDPAAWMQAVAAASRRLRAGEAEKVVLAREVLAHADGALSASRVASALRSAHPSCYTFLFEGADGTAFVGATPELLVRRQGLAFTSQPMAGTVGRGVDEADDDRLAAQLLGSAKDLAEHRLVPAAVVEGLRPLADSVDDPGRPEIVRFTDIQHLATTVRARLRAPAPGALELASRLHPTPAVGGRPAAAAFGLIAELEDMERGWYAGGVGWQDARGDGEVAVALRCGLLWGDGARLYAGAGIMPDSDPASELAETEVKLSALLGALARERG